MVKDSLVGLLLIIGSITDIRTRKISAKLLLLFGIIAIIGGIVLLQFDAISMIPGMVPGILLLLLGKVTGESIGYGDGYLLIVIGLFLGAVKTTELLMLALFISALYSVFLISCKKSNRKREIPFIPILLAAFILMRFI